MSKFVLVHGAWGSAQEFDCLIRILSKTGHDVTAVDLPGHGNNKAQASEVTLDAYVQEVIRVVQQKGGKVILAGHSLGGVVISRVAEIVPEKINRLIYIAAMLPKTSVTAFEIMQSDGGSELAPYTQLSQENRTIILDPKAVPKVMLNDVSDESEIERMLPLFAMEQPAMPFSAPIELSDARFGSVPKFYIRASLDKVIPPSLQDKMIKNWALEYVFDLQSGHFPFVSMPEKLADLLYEAEEH